MTMRYLAAAAALFAALAALPGAARAQDSSDVRLIRATLVLYKNFQDPRLGAVVTKSARTETNIIAIKRSGATAELLGATVASLQEAQRRLGDTISVPVQIRLYAGARWRSLNASEREWCEAALSRLSQAPVREVPGVGRARAIDVRIPTM